MCAVPIPRPGTRLPWWRIAFACSVVLQLVVLYAPDAPGPDGLVPHRDKLVHALIFGLAAFTAVRSGLPRRPVAGLLVAHAAASELIQHFLLPHRSGDPWDAVADTVGVLLGVWLASRGGRVKG